MSDYEISRNQLNESIKAIEKEIEECKYFINTLDVKRQTLQQTITRKIPKRTWIHTKKTHKTRSKRRI